MISGVTAKDALINALVAGRLMSVLRASGRMGVPARPAAISLNQSTIACVAMHPPGRQELDVSGQHCAHKFAAQANGKGLSIVLTGKWIHTH